MKKYLVFITYQLINLLTYQLPAQGTLQNTVSTYLTTTGNVFLVADNMNVINNGSYVQAIGDGTTKFTGNSNSTFSGSGITTLDKMEVAKSSAISHTLSSTISLKNVLTITSGILASNGFLILKSDATTTARVAPIASGSITGDVMAERYNSNRRAWRLLGIPYSTSTQTIRQSWMENGSAPGGYGTQITTFTGDPNAANFDAQRPASSIRTYAADNFNSDAVHTPNTTNPLTSNQAYFLFVRGDRTIDRMTAGAASGATTLRALGAINQGNVTKGVTGTSFSLIPNPYPSPVDFDAIKSIAANSSINTFYVWDASLGSVGQYRTVQISGAAPNYTYSATPGSANNNWRFIESGTAFMVSGSRTVDFTEATKAAGIPPSSMLRTSGGNETELVINLYSVGTDNKINLADGVREVFDNIHTAAIDREDAKKITGFELNLGIINDNNVLAVEKRPMPKQDDVINLMLWNASNTLLGNYQFEFMPNNFPADITPYLKDNYLNTETAIDRNSTTNINFTISRDAGSANLYRFSIVFAKSPPANTKPAIVIYPNPVTNGNITLHLNNIPGGIYEVRLLNALGQIVFRKQINHSGGSSPQTIYVNKIKGTYLLEIIKPDKSKQTNKIIIN